MTGRQGGRRSITMPLIDRTRIISANTDPAEVEHPILLWRNLMEDNEVVRNKIDLLGLNPNDMHGDLQVIRTALKRMEQSVDKLIAIEQGEK